MATYPRRAVLRVPDDQLATAGDPDLPVELAIVARKSRPELGVVELLVAGQPLDVIADGAEAPVLALEELRLACAHHRAGTASILEPGSPLDVADGNIGGLP